MAVFVVICRPLVRLKILAVSRPHRQRCFRMIDELCIKGLRQVSRVVATQNLLAIKEVAVATIIRRHTRALAGGVSRPPVAILSLRCAFRFTSVYHFRH